MAAGDLKLTTSFTISVPTAEENAAAVWAAAPAGALALPAPPDVIAAEVWAEAPPAVPTGPTAEEVAAAVWDEPSAVHAAEGSEGAQLARAAGTVDPLSELLPGPYAPGTAGWALSLLLGPTKVVVQAPTVVEGRLTGLVAGDDYTADGHGALLFLVGLVPSLVGASLTFRAVGETGDELVAVGVLVDDGNPKQVSVSLMGEMTRALVGRYAFTLVASNVGVTERTITLAAGELEFTAALA